MEIIINYLVDGIAIACFMIPIALALGVLWWITGKIIKKIIEDVMLLNLLEHYVKRIYSIKDITEIVKEHIEKPDLLTKYYEVDMEIDYHGVNERVKVIFTDEGLDELKNKGFYLL